MYSNEDLLEIKKQLEDLDNKIDTLLKKDYSIQVLELTNSFSNIPEPCRNCSNHPSNGGSGICNCILGEPKITY